jgi:hypothetical protein
MNINEITSEIYEELERAESLHPKFPTDLVYQCAIMIEEAGETMKAVLDYKSGKCPRSDIVKEAIQTGAMVIRFLKNINGAT